jgi:hypothetical protein
MVKKAYRLYFAVSSKYRLMFSFYSKKEKENYDRDTLCDIFISNLISIRLVSLTRSCSDNTLIMPSVFNGVKVTYKCTKQIV